MRKTAIFFDFDGVILESANIKTDAFLELFSAYPENLDRIRQHHVDNMGVSRFRKFEWIYNEVLNRQISPDESKALGDKFTELTFRKIIECPFVPGAQDLLQWTKNRVKCFVVSGTPQDELIQIIRQRGLSEYFTEVRGAPDTKSNIIEQLLHKYSLNEQGCLFVGDAITDYNAALASNVDFIARHTEELSTFWREKGVVAVDNLMEIVPVVE